MTQPSVSIFIVGGPKCGTTALAEMLSKRPRLQLSLPKETYLFGTDLGALHQRFTPFLENLDESFRGDQPFRVEATTLALASNDAVDRILDEFPGALFIVCARPIDKMVTSWSGHVSRYGWDTDPSDLPLPWMGDAHVVCDLAGQLQRHLARGAADRTLIVDSESLRRDPQQIVEAVERFIGVPLADRPVPIEASSANTAVMPRNTGLFTLLHDSRYQRGAILAKRLLPDQAQATLRAAKDRLVFSTRKPDYVASPETVEFAKHQHAVIRSVLPEFAVAGEFLWC